MPRTFLEYQVSDPKMYVLIWNFYSSVIFVVIFSHLRDLVVKIFVVLSYQLIANNSFVRHLDFIVIGSFLSIDTDGNLISVSATIFKLQIYAEY